MDKKELLSKMETFSQQFMETLAEFEAIKKQVQGVFEENARLRMENNSLIEHLKQASNEEPVHNPYRGQQYLESIYEEGFHVCNDSYGQRLDDKYPSCMSCVEFLYGERDASTKII
ncbi:initiation control protein YabA [Streptococcus plurextorum]|uniref:initiation control protein YabA n=1 Tax=Streptococcus plurextorum TaxID=456876 RepID=UPI00042403BB|nr:initiation control protein YabA [Streptococcus plurextorum]